MRAARVQALAWVLAVVPACGAGSASPSPSMGASGGASGATAGGSGAASASGGASQGGGGGASGDGASGGGASGDGVGGAASDPCAARSGLLFCDSFENAEAGQALPSPWVTQIIGDATTFVSVDASTPAHSGANSVHVAGTGFQSLFAFHDPALLPAPGGRLYVRVFMRLAAPMSDGHNTFFLADLFSAPGAGNTARIGEDFDMLMMTVSGDAHGYLSNQNYFIDRLPGVGFDVGRWTCLETLFDAPHTEIDVWVDEREVPDMHPTDIVQDAYDELRFGFEKYAGPSSDLWYDDIAFGTERIGCQ